MSTATDRFQYGYDENSNRLFRRNVVDATFSELYAYDNFDQLSDFARGTLSTTSDSIVGMPVRSQNWDPHPLGNAEFISTDGTPESRTYNAQNQFDTVGGNPLDYDNNGNLIVDQNGNLYFYDAWNRLVKVEDSSNDLLTAYSYNPLNRRIIEDDGTTETHLFYSANWQVLEEQVASDTTVQYVWSPVYIDALILRDRDTDSNGSLDERLYVQQDANFNVTALVDALTGDVVQRFVQDPFGLVTDVLDDSWTPQSDAFDWKYLHQGLRLDMAVGMNLYDGRNRIYDPVLQRWLQVDPSGFSAGDSNLYRYVGNGPTNATDPSGLDEARGFDRRPGDRHPLAKEGVPPTLWPTWHYYFDSQSGLYAYGDNLGLPDVNDLWFYSQDKGNWYKVSRVPHKANWVEAGLIPKDGPAGRVWHYSAEEKRLYLVPPAGWTDPLTKVHHKELQDFTMKNLTGPVSSTLPNLNPDPFRPLDPNAQLLFKQSEQAGKDRLMREAVSPHLRKVIEAGGIPIGSSIVIRPDVPKLRSLDDVIKHRKFPVKEVSGNIIIKFGPRIGR